jgi:transcription antitermination protein NusB
MASRRQAREYALAALYEADLREAPAVPCLGDLWATLLEGEGTDPGRPAEAEEVEFAERIVFGVTDRKEAIDAMIDQCSTNWRLTRMPVVDRNILRIAAFELLACADIPPNVSINEAIELGKKFGSGDTKSFVNGIVDRMGRQTGRISGSERKQPVES